MRQYVAGEGFKPCFGIAFETVWAARPHASSSSMREMEFEGTPVSR